VQRFAAFREGNVDRLEDTAHIRDAQWKVDPVPAELLERRVELLGGCGRQELVQGMNAGAKSYIADLWNMCLGDPASVMRAHRMLERAVDGRLAYVDPDGGRVRISPNSITRLMLVPRPLHALEGSVRTDGQAVPASFFDLAVYCAHNAVKLRVRQAGVYFYLRGVHGHAEARLWKQLFEHIEEHLSLPRGTLRATVMMDSLAAVLEADEILFELSHHSSGLSLDPQAYAADHIALFSAPDRPTLPDRERIGLNDHMLRSVSLMTIAVCHRRQAHAIGAPAFILPQDDRSKLKANYLQMIADKEREAVDGHDGTLVGHPGLVGPAMTEFNKSMPRAHQMYYERKNTIAPSDLVQRPQGSITTDGLVGTIRTVLRALVYRSMGQAVVIQGARLHDRSSVRLSTLLLWQWTRSSHGVITDTGLEVHDDLMKYMVRKEGEKLFGREDDAALREAGKLAVATLTAAMLRHELPDDLLG
jgi:malate synthase